jgi:hypothetical protein
MPFDNKNLIIAPKSRVDRHINWSVWFQPGGLHMYKSAYGNIRAGEFALGVT